MSLTAEKPKGSDQGVLAFLKTARSTCSRVRRMRAVGVVAALVLLVVGLAARFGTPVAATTPGTAICGPITIDTTWTLAGSPYTVCNTYTPTVAQGVTLTVEPGVVVRFERLGRLDVAGKLIAIGTSTEPIIFTGVIQSPGSWQGLTIRVRAFRYLKYNLRPTHLREFEVQLEKTIATILQKLPER